MIPEMHNTARRQLGHLANMGFDILKIVQCGAVSSGWEYVVPGADSWVSEGDLSGAKEVFQIFTTGSSSYSGAEQGRRTLRNGSIK